MTKEELEKICEREILKLKKESPILFRTGFRSAMSILIPILDEKEREIERLQRIIQAYVKQEGNR